jgi:large subunit ribosomal protein L1
VLGPQGKMPSPKSGTVTPDVAAAVKEFKAGKVEFRTDAGGNVHAPLGKKSFALEDLQANLVAFLEHVSTLRPPATKGAFLRKISVSTTMGPGVLVSWEVTHVE